MKQIQLLVPATFYVGQIIDNVNKDGYFVESKILEITDTTIVFQEIRSGKLIGEIYDFIFPAFVNILSK